MHRVCCAGVTGQVITSAGVRIPDFGLFVVDVVDVVEAVVVGGTDVPMSSDEVHQVALPAAHCMQLDSDFEHQLLAGAASVLVAHSAQ